MAVFLFALFALGLERSVAQSGFSLHFRPVGELYFPLDTYADSLTGAATPLYSMIGYGVGAIIDFSAMEWLRPFVRGEYISAPYSGGASSLDIADGGIG
ncbi:MAG TPA: hypothetical protein VMV44_04290, partial [Rectinemataceae bacterium]|nr:hypothetical protein [Rectinemataceae bacterium]